MSTSTLKRVTGALLHGRSGNRALLGSVFGAQVLLTYLYLTDASQPRKANR